MKKIRISLVALFVLTTLAFSFNASSFEAGVRERYTCSLHDADGLPHFAMIDQDNLAMCISLLSVSQWENHLVSKHNVPTDSSGNIINKNQYDADHCVKVDPFY